MSQNITILLVAIYITLAATLFCTQFVLAFLNFIKQKSNLPENIKKTKEYFKNNPEKKVSIIYPIYNEDPEVLEKVLSHASKTQKALSFLDVVFVDDGSKNLAEVEKLYKKYTTDKFKVIYQENGGKRVAQYTGFEMAKDSEFIITVDSDTLINADGVIKLLAPMVVNPRIGAVTGDVRVENRDTNLLTTLISVRYWLAFNLERAAQSYSGSMLCCSGPFSVYRNDVIQKVKDKYINQIFFGKVCTYGDDRHLTNLVISEGYETIYQQEAVAYTFVPENMAEYIKQQTRWNKSFYREFFWTIRSFSKVSFYSLMDTTLQIILLFLFTINLGINFANLFVFKDLKIVVYYMITILLVACLRSIYGLFRTGNWKFMLSVFYGIIHIVFLIPLRFKALLTLNDNNWGTRNAVKFNPYTNFLKWMLGYFVVVGVIAFFAVNLGSKAIADEFSNNASFADYGKSLNLSFSSVAIILFAIPLIFALTNFVRNTEGLRLKYALASLAVLMLLSGGLIYTISDPYYTTENPRIKQLANLSDMQSAGKNLASIDSQETGNKGAVAGIDENVEKSSSSSFSASSIENVLKFTSNESTDLYVEVIDEGENMTVASNLIIDRYLSETKIEMDSTQKSLFSQKLVEYFGNRDLVYPGEQLTISSDFLIKLSKESKPTLS